MKKFLLLCLCLVTGRRLTVFGGSRFLGEGPSRVRGSGRRFYGLMGSSLSGVTRVGGLRLGEIGRLRSRERGFCFVANRILKFRG